MGDTTLLTVTASHLQAAMAALTLATDHLFSVSIGPDKSRAASVALTNVDTALLWIRHDLERRSVPLEETPSLPSPEAGEEGAPAPTLPAPAAGDVRTPSLPSPETGEEGAPTIERR